MKLTTDTGSYGIQSLNIYPPDTVEFGTIHAMYVQTRHGELGSYSVWSLALCLHVKRLAFAEVYSMNAENLDPQKIHADPGVNCRACLEVIHA